MFSNRDLIVDLFIIFKCFKFALALILRLIFFKLVLLPLFGIITCMQSLIKEIIKLKKWVWILLMILSSSKALWNFFLNLFYYYYNNCQPLHELCLFDKTIELSEKTKSFYDLLEYKRNEKIKKNIITITKMFYINDINPIELVEKNN